MLAFVSGKGGVGKTTLASNLAYAVAAAKKQCVLIDTDFQNLGCTGLFEARYELPNTDMLALLRDCPGEITEDLLEVAPGLRFVPASFRFPNTDMFLDDSDDLARRFVCVLDALAVRFNTEMFILDCHGAVDATSIAAAGLADETIIVTEADTVTFAGTLELVDAYYLAHRRTEQPLRLSYVVNRIPPKYRWRDLEDIYRKHIAISSGLPEADEVPLVFIPTENYIAESFGEYPFQVKLAPQSLFAAKVTLLLFLLQGRLARQDLVPIVLRRHVRTERRRRRIARRVISNEAANIRMVFVAYSLGTLAAAVFIVSVVVWLSLGRDPKLETMGFALLELSIAPFYIVVMFRIWLYFGERYRFEKALLRVLPRQEAMWRRFRLWRLRSLYIGSALGPFAVMIVLSLYGILYFFFTFVVRR